MEAIFTDAKLMLEFSGYSLIIMAVGMIMGIVLRDTLTELLTKREDKDDETNDKRDRG
tara:strand:+ start:1095 stop:1268 length:174 start_codon:yes stop_codon:yes gene_type:complete